MGFLPPYEPTTWKILAGVGVLILLAIIFWAFSGGKGKDETPLLINVGVDQGKNDVINSLVTNQEKVVNEKSQNTNQAVNALNASVNRPSNQFDGQGSGDRFCRDFPNDPSCLRTNH